MPLSRRWLVFYTRTLPCLLVLEVAMHPPMSLLEKLQHAWFEKEPPDLRAFLKEGADVEQLAAMVLLDMERRWSRAHGLSHDPSEDSREHPQPLPRLPVVEDYLKTFVGVLDFDADRLCQLLGEEYWIRLQWNQCPSHEEYVARFPELATRLLPLLREIDGQFVPSDVQGSLVEVDARLAGTIALKKEDTLPDEASLKRGSSGKRVFGEYELLEELARGGMGVVYKARQVKANRIVALKMILSGQFANEEDVRRFHAEAQAAAKLEHPNIVPIYDVGECDGQHYFSMAYVKGQTLKELVADGPLPSGRAARFAELISDAVGYAHSQGIVHRDLKPANVIVDLGDNPRVTDFGLAKELDADSDLTATGQVMGTPSYMPPEQAAGKIDQIGPRSDVYALGAILYELLTGRPPFQAASVLDILNAVLHQDPVPPRTLNPALERDLETICLKCLQKSMDGRYVDCAALSADLRRYRAGEPIRARPVSSLERLLRWCRRKPTAAGLWGVSFAAVLMTVGLSLYFTAHLT
jgi:tRNA A-37 threonylcarbamoyl transferase component Bud32